MRLLRLRSIYGSVSLQWHIPITSELVQPLPGSRRQFAGSYEPKITCK